MSNELKEFTSQDMRGCPPFGFCSTIENRLVAFVLVNRDSKIVVDTYKGHEFLSTIKCNPIDRCHAIARHLFELMPNAQKILIAGVEVLVMFEESFDELSINPFLHCDITEITREELGL